MTREDIDRRAIDILRRNDRGHHTVPTAGLYPFQWNWDSAFVALGFAVFDRDRAWREIEILIQIIGVAGHRGIVPNGDVVIVTTIADVHVAADVGIVEDRNRAFVIIVGCDRCVGVGFAGIIIASR